MQRFITAHATHPDAHMALALAAAQIDAQRAARQPWFNATAFSVPRAGTFGSAPLNLLRGPGFQNWDVALFKNFRFTERLSGQLRAESFNFLNHPLLSNPNTNPRSGDFSRVTSKYNERNLQLGLKIIF